MKVYSLAIKNAKKDRIVCGYLDDENMYIDERGHLIISESISTERSEDQENLQIFAN